MKKSILLTVTLLLFIPILFAKYTQTCKVKYRNNYSWSKYYTVDVTFLSGHELNKATKSFDYDTYNTYAVIFWDDDEASVIKVDSYTGCGTEVKQSCITNKVMNLEGEDQQGVKWELCTKSYCY